MHTTTRQNKPDISYFMPLSNGARPQDGPSKSVFSVPAFKYSPETQAVVKNFMDESRLTFTQKTGFQSILRNGKALPIRPMDLFRQQLYKHRHAERARSMGVSVMNPTHNPFMSRRRYAGGGGRRTYDVIQTAVESDKPCAQARRYIPRDKEQEKIRFAHRMAYGKDPPQKVCTKDLEKLEPLVTKLSAMEISANSKSLMDERYDEMVQEVMERVEFLNSMKLLGNEKSYKGPITSQIQELIRQMKAISPEKVDSTVKALNLGMVDKSFSDNAYEFQNIFADAESENGKRRLLTVNDKYRFVNT